MSPPAGIGFLRIRAPVYLEERSPRPRDVEMSGSPKCFSPRPPLGASPSDRVTAFAPQRPRALLPVPIKQSGVADSPPVQKPTALIGMPSAKEWTDLLFLLPEGQREPIVRLCDPTYVQTSLELFERKGASSEDLASLLASKQREHKENIAIAKAKMSSYFRTLKVCGWMEKTRSPAMERSLESDSPHPWAKYFHPDIIRDVHVFFPELRSVRSVV